MNLNLSISLLGLAKRFGGYVRMVMNGKHIFVIEAKEKDVAKNARR